ncbi:RagB/SusD family nutrient uptake outer membrane protein [Ochrovirga pacifica]|uniref:RagB/SusD family nutrient uptake outer membrane protein n=1 Tax=Ochrovirga pacifica TaxID=1042376 RepID=UPI0009FE3C32|nr:RagB/SusD family nutrient uptake outer membrane protein [Ochrovirga pacifica]
MKAKYIQIITPLLLLMIIFQSCTDELDQINPNALTTSSYWKNTADMNAGLNAVYASLRDENVSGIMFEDKRTDIAVPNTYRNRLTGDPVYDQTFDLTTGDVQDKWAACYEGVFRANQVIDAFQRLSPTFSGTELEFAERIYAQARAIRGYYYYVLHSSFNKGSLPLHETVPVDFEDFQKPFSSATEIQDFYRADLKYGIENLPATYSAWQDVGGSNLGRITAGACEAIMAKSYMNDNDFTNAKVYLENVMNNYGYILVDDLAQCFTEIAEFNSESIFEVNYTVDLNSLNDGEKLLSQRISEWLHVGRLQPSSWLTLQYRADKVDPADPENAVTQNVYDPADGEVIGTKDTIRQYSLRMANSISSIDDPNTTMYGVTSGEYGIDRNAPAHSKNFPNLWKKFTHWNVNNGGAGEEFSPDLQGKSGINIPVIRLAEIYLLYAECMIEEGNLSEALRYINRIRKRSHLILLGKSTDAGVEFANASTTYMDDIDMDPTNGEEEVTLENLKQHLRFVEKPLELALEAERTIDLRRWGVWKEQLQNIASFEYDAYHYNKNLNGKHPKRFRCFIMPTGEVPYFPLGGLRSKDAQLRDALLGSSNFNEELHAYFPIPQTEINANLNWDK